VNEARGIACRIAVVTACELVRGMAYDMVRRTADSPRSIFRFGRLNSPRLRDAIP
jgi:hypothetical protein